MSEKREDSVRTRIMEAKKYQRMAIEALIPEEQKEHLDIIEKEMKTLLVNGMLDLLIETGAMDRVVKYATEYFKEEDKTESKTEHKKDKTVRKVVIGE